jgi:OmpA-OmpF porin, OOP family
MALATVAAAMRGTGMASTLCGLNAITALRALALVGLLAQIALPLQAQEGTVDLGTSLPATKTLEEGLFPDDACEELKANGFKCMGFKPAVRFSLPAAAFAIGSAELPDGLKRQLDRFAQVLKGKSGNGRAVRIEGHADASGQPAANDELSQRRANAARDYLVDKGVSPELLKPVGLGAKQPIEPSQPLSAKNRRVVIGREQPPVSP